MILEKSIIYFYMLFALTFPHKMQDFSPIQTIEYQNACISYDNEFIIGENINKENDKIIEDKTTIPKQEITISFAGDFTMGEYKGQGKRNQYIDYYNEFGHEYFLKNVKHIFENDDLTFINLEGPLTNYEQVVEKSFPIKGIPEYVNILSCSSIEVCNLANNHTFDCGQNGYDETKEILSLNNIGYCGYEDSYTTQIGDFIVTFLGYKGWNDTDELRATIKMDIDKAKSNGSNVICVMFHYGEERVYYSNKTQEDLSRYTIDCGASIVIGGHPHVIQGIEKYKDKTICYSLGNFTFGANKNPKDKDTFIFQQTFKIDDYGNITYGDYNIIPCSISSETNKNTYQPTPLENESKDRVLDRLKEYSSIYEFTIF